MFYVHWIQCIQWTFECALETWCVQWIQWTCDMSNGHLTGQIYPYEQGRRNRGGTGGTCPPKFYEVVFLQEKVPFFQCGLCAIVPFYLQFSFLELKNMIAVVSFDKQFTCFSLPICTVNQRNLLYSQSTFQIYPSIRPLIHTRKTLNLQLKSYSSISFNHNSICNII